MTDANASAERPALPDHLSIDPSLSLALAALPNIKHLIIPAGERAAAFLDTIHWPLETVDLRENFHIDVDAWVLGEPELIDDWSPALLFKNAGTGAYNMVYRRGDGTIGWVEPQRGG